MEQSANNNPYAFARMRALHTYACHLSGAKQALFLVVFYGDIEEDVRTALDKTCAALGYGAQATYLRIDVAGSALDAPTLFGAVEALDPLCVVIADETALGFMEKSYACSIPVQTTTRVLTRDTRAFDHLSAQLSSPEGKQDVWAVLKSFPHLAE